MNLSSFILTIRNVKPKDERPDLGGGGGFILTIRNVKTGIKSVLSVNKNSFILTIRNVKKGFAPTVIGVIGFYLNYKECEVCIRG